MKRVMIVGGPGSGKSTLARALGKKTGLPVYHMDHIHWMSGWEMRPTPERYALAHEVEARDRWIFEGGMSSTYATRAARADTLIWLDLPVGLRLWRVTKRLVVYLGRQRPDMAPGCYEGLHSQTLPFYLFIWNNRHIGRRKNARLFEDVSGSMQTFHLHSPGDVRSFLADVPDASEVVVGAP